MLRVLKQVVGLKPRFLHVCAGSGLSDSFGTRRGQGCKSVRVILQSSFFKCEVSTMLINSQIIAFIISRQRKCNVYILKSNW